MKKKVRRVLGDAMREAKPSTGGVRVAAYIRVSTEKGQQADSYETQERYYTDFLAAHADWVSAGIYADYAISGVSNEKRKGFQRLLRHCAEGQIDRVLCKSVSRFARNTADFIMALRILKDNHTTIFFEKENLDTAGAANEFILATLGAIAQEESRSISENLRWGMQKRYPQGETAKKLIDIGMCPGDLFTLSQEDLIEKLALQPMFAERIVRLIDRNASLTFELSRYANMGIYVVTRADASYPAKLKKALGNHCPPIFYCAGDMTLTKREYAGYVGSRTVTAEDAAFTKATIQKTVSYGYGVVSGGAKGIDAISETEALQADAPTIAFLSDSMQKKMRKSETIKAIQAGKLLLLSVVKPDAGFNVGIAMMRNRYIYAQSAGTIVVRADYNKGGTWAGAEENLKNNWCVEFCWCNKEYPGNMALIKKGANPIDADWDGDIRTAAKCQKTEAPEQLKLFSI